MNLHKFHKELSNSLTVANKYVFNFTCLRNVLELLANRFTAKEPK